jgi:dolichol-phosphate mannosyltransferase
VSAREDTQLLVVVPCYNERDNVVALVDEILASYPRARVCIVEDSSPDGTTEVVRRALVERPTWLNRVHLIVRTKKDGRGGAVRDGLVWGIGQTPAFDAFVEMDCDFSHEPAAIEQGLTLLAAGNDVVIGARYPDGTIIGWTYERRIFSFFANSLARALIDRHISDYTNGFRFYSERAVRLLVGIEQHHKGYIYLSESLSHLLRAGMRVASFPIRFRNRERGESNTSLKEISSALTGIFQIAWQHRFGDP